jgi:hypothetical protein
MLECSAAISQQGVEEIEQFEADAPIPLAAPIITVPITANRLSGQGKEFRIPAQETSVE